MCARPYLERYKACSSAGEVEEAQDDIMRELEASYQRSREEGGMSPFFLFHHRSLLHCFFHLHLAPSLPTLSQAGH